MPVALLDKQEHGAMGEAMVKQQNRCWPRAGPQTKGAVLRGARDRLSGDRGISSNGSGQEALETASRYLAVIDQKSPWFFPV